MGVHSRRDDAVRLGKTSQRGVVPAGVVPTGGFALVHKTKRSCVGVLSRISILRQRRSALEADFAPGFVFRLREGIPILEGDGARRAETCAERVEAWSLSR